MRRGPVVRHPNPGLQIDADEVTCRTTPSVLSPLRCGVRLSHEVPFAKGTYWVSFTIVQLPAATQLRIGFLQDETQDLFSYERRFDHPFCLISISAFFECRHLCCVQIPGRFVPGSIRRIVLE